MALTKFEKLGITLGSLGALASVIFVAEYSGWVRSISAKSYPLLLSNGHIEVSIIGGAVSVSAILTNPTSAPESVVFAVSVYDMAGNLISNSTNGLFIWDAGFSARIQTDPKGLYSGNQYEIKAWIMDDLGNQLSNTLTFSQSI